ncbi:unnamed protein product [Merluccius merluccius]
MNHLPRLPHQQQQQHHGCSGSERDLHSATSSLSLPSIRKTPKKRRLSLHSLFGRRQRHHREPRRCKLRPLQSGGSGADVAAAASDESIPSESSQGKSSAHAAHAVHAAAAMTSSLSMAALATAAAASAGSSELQECPLCLLRHGRDRFPDIMTCHHRSCGDCLRQYLRIEISESRINICCPECPERYNPHDIQVILADRAVMEKYEEFMLRRWLVADPDCRWCPAPDCGYAVIAFGCASCPKLTCGRDGCGTEFCYHCKQLWHPDQTCDAARKQRAQSLQLGGFRSSSLSHSQESGAPADDIKPCPRCAAYIIKMNDGSCNHMTCAVCGCEFCWLCMKEISDLHYLSPSGCTFWGKKPWSRKKKILWQLGTLVGAPVGIALIAGIAVPAMVIGIPVYVGRKIHNRYEGKEVSKHKRNLVIAGGVTLSVIVSPVVAAVTVGIGVPIMLAYVYGVVPISLCRSGGCGVSAGNGKGVRIEFDDENDVYVGSGVGATDNTSVAETRLYNPSLGDGASVGGLTGLSLSGSHLERCGASGTGGSAGGGSTQRDASLGDHDDASTTALAGASITGSLSSGCYNRLEVQADVRKESCSLGGDSATVSLGAAGDDASTRAMAGSILNAYTPLERSGQQSGGAGGRGAPAAEEAALQRQQWSRWQQRWWRWWWWCKGRLWRRVGGGGGGGGSSSKAEAEVTRKAKGADDTETDGRRRLERRGARSPGPDPPSPSGSLPSVASDSRCSLSSSDASETSRPPPPPLFPPTPPAAAAALPGNHHPRLARAAATAMPEVEYDRLERGPPLPQGTDTASVVERSQGGGTFLFIAEETKSDSAVNVEPDDDDDNDKDEDQSETTSQDPTALHATSPASRRSCIQTDI